ncbi:MAG: hypothetical protein AB7O48_15925 [Cyclobacteriaceae bacterium]
MHKLIIKTITTATIITYLVGCSEEDTFPVGAIEEAAVFDIGNVGDASDIYVSLKTAASSSPLEIRVTLIKSSDVEFLREIELNSLDDTMFKTFTHNGGEANLGLQLNPEMRDLLGNAIEPNLDYEVRFVLISNGEARFATTMTTFILKDQSPLIGRYRGLWSDNIYTNFGISADLKPLAENSVSGSFYYSREFKPCCGGSDDGIVTLTATEQSSIQFIYDQNLLTFMGGCPGQYTGSGEIVDFVKLEINFSGNDCEGPHTGGKIVLNRVK